MKLFRLLFWLLAWGGAVQVHAADRFWTNTQSSANFTNTPGIWNGVVPGTGDQAFFTNNLSYTANWTSSVTNTAVIFGGTSGIVTQNIGSGNIWRLTSGYFIATNTGSAATVVQTSGRLSIANSLVVGSGVGSSGTLALLGGNLDLNGGGTGRFNIGTNGQGTVIIDGASLFITNLQNGSNIEVGTGANGSGTLTFRSGTVTNFGIGGSLVLGNFGAATASTGATGTYTQTGGTWVQRGGSVQIARRAYNVGTMTLAGNAVMQYIGNGVSGVDFFLVGNSGPGTLVITNNASLIMTNFGPTQGFGVGNVAGSVGTVLQSGGLISLAGTTINFLGNAAGAQGTIVLSGGQFNADLGAGGLLYIGQAGQGTLTIGGGSLVITSSVVSSSTGLIVGGAAGGSGLIQMNSGLVTNFSYFSVGNNVSGSGNSTGVYTQVGGNWVQSVGLSVGRGGSQGTLTISGGRLDVVGDGSVLSALLIGNSGLGWLNMSGGYLIVTNLDPAQGFYLGNAPGSSGTINFSGGTITNYSTFGAGRNNPGATGTVVQSGGTWIQYGVAQIGATGSGSVTITGGVFQAGGDLTLGLVSTGNGTLTIGGDGFVSVSGVLSAGVSGAASVLITTNGTLEANTLVRTGAGNTISNRAGIYQFTTNTPTILRNAGNIALTDGTISFRAITNADVYGNWNNTLTNITFAGANTFRLNAASNTIANQSYTFNPGLGATNYARLEMINGQTAYRGGDITIGSGGSMLVSSTIATVSGLITNSGSMSVVGGAVTYQGLVYNTGTNTMLNSLGTFNGGVINAGAWLTDPTTNVYSSFGFTNTISGVVSMSAGDVYRFTNTAGVAANFINVSTNKVANHTLAGTMIFEGGLGLTQQFTVAGHDLGPTPLPTATNAVPGLTTSALTGFTNNFALGTLEISNFSTVQVTDAFLGLTGLGTNDGQMAGLYLNNLIIGTGGLLIIDTNVQVYFLHSNDWTSANFDLVGNSGFDNTLNGLHQLVVVPEPSTLLLMLGGVLTMLFARHRRRQR